MKKISKISSSSKAKFCVSIGITLNWDDHTISLFQMALIDKIIHQFGQQDAYPANSPMDPGLKI